MNYWTDPRTWRNWWKPPHAEWWILPSGGDSQTSWSNLVVDILLESPLGAHLLGSIISYAIGFLVTGNRWAAFSFTAMWAVVGQGQKADALLPLNRYNGREMVWRIVIGTVPLGAALLGYELLF